jgi:hypothetical protein
MKEVMMVEKTDNN